MGDESVAETRGGFRGKKYTEDVRQLVKDHINSVQRQQSHYGRKFSEKEYLSGDLSFVSLHAAFKEKLPDIDVSVDFYTKVFKQNFPNLSFRALRVDTCTTCDCLECKIKTFSKDKKICMAAKAELSDHHAKANKSRSVMKNDKLESGRRTCVSIVLQQVLSVPTLKHSEMFYLRQLSCYNFGVHVSLSNSAFICLWNESYGGR